MRRNQEMILLTSPREDEIGRSKSFHRLLKRVKEDEKEKDEPSGTFF
jgi:hypothetical protein